MQLLSFRNSWRYFESDQEAISSAMFSSLTSSIRELFCLAPVYDPSAPTEATEANEAARLEPMANGSLRTR